MRASSRHIEPGTEMNLLFVDDKGNRVQACVFCGSTVDITKEHVLAKRWRQLLGAADASHAQHGWEVGRGGEVEEFSKKFPGRPSFSWTVKTVCRQCNNGWLSVLEEAAFQYLAPMVAGESPELSSHALRVVEKWAIKTAIVIETQDDSRKSLNPAFTSLVMNAPLGRPLPNSLVWIIAADHENGERHRSSIGAVFKSDHECDGHVWRVTSIHLGSIAVFTVHSGDALAMESVIKREPEELMGPALLGETGTWTIKRDAPITREGRSQLHTDLSNRLAPDGIAPPTRRLDLK